MIWRKKISGRFYQTIEQFAVFIACPLSVLEKAFSKLAAALKE